jgi:hypothetical protein
MLNFDYWNISLILDVIHHRRKISLKQGETLVISAGCRAGDKTSVDNAYLDQVWMKYG